MRKSWSVYFLGTVFLLISCGPSTDPKPVKLGPSQIKPQISQVTKDEVLPFYIFDSKTKEKRTLTVDDLETMEVVTWKVWDFHENKTIDYTGVVLKDFISKYLPGKPSEITMIAYNDYASKFKPHHWTNFNALIAFKQDGNYLTLENKGPVRVIFKLDQNAGRIVDGLLPLWIWQVKTIEGHYGD
ncbi:MAG: hypothetical protein MK193_05715 [Lentisphaeria bacterium]|nr:hypothetical protein [Lentisphaeria bacterium]